VWIRDARTGARRLIDIEALVILRAASPGDTFLRPPATAATATAATPTAGTASPATVAAAKSAVGVLAQPASNLPLFHAPGLAG
jgi:hypothetical protein